MMTLIQNPQSSQNTRLKDPCTAERTPHNTTRPEQPHISASQLRSYSGCPLAWQLSRTRRPEYVSAMLVFGSAFHAAAEHFYQQRLEGKTAIFTDLLEAYDAKWKERDNTESGTPLPPVKYFTKADPVELPQTAARMLEAFLTHATACVAETSAVEEEFRIQMAPDLPTLQGRIHLIETRRDASGERQPQSGDF